VVEMDIFSFLDKVKLISDSALDQMKVENLDFDSAKNVSTAKSGQTKATVIKEHLFDKDTNKLPSKEIETNRFSGFWFHLFLIYFWF
jgi:hypothetical protein